MRIFGALFLLFVLFIACNEQDKENSSTDINLEMDIPSREEVLEDGGYYDSSPCDRRVVIGIDPDNLISTRKHWDVFNEAIFIFCDSIGLSCQSWSGDPSRAEISMCNDGISVELSKYQANGLGYLLCNQDDWQSEEYNFKFVSGGNSERIISEIEQYFLTKND